MAHVHLGMAVANWEVQEHVEQDAAPFTSMVNAVPTVVDGYLHAFDAPGLGMTLADDYLTAAPVTVFPVDPDLRVDGSVAMR
jgi:L-alanine-DL-glutamate epimerase-like enolase superfamily enzyme